MGIQSLIPALFVAFVVTVAFMLVLHPFAPKIGLVDQPGGRKLHDGNVPVIGGIAMFIGMFVGILVGSYLLSPPMSEILSAVVAAFLLVSIGAIDDNIALPTYTRMLAQVSAVLIMVYGGKLQLTDIGDPFGTGVISMGRFSLIFTMLVSVAVINAYNLIDGVDGLAGSMVLLALLPASIVAGIGHPYGATALIVVASVIGFLLFNFPFKWNRTTLSFMGDAGSTLLGFTIVWIMIGIAQGAGAAQGTESLISPVHCLWFAAIPIFDCFTCFILRIRQKKSPFTPGRDHFHHILNNGGFGTRQVLGILVGLQSLYTIIGLAGYFSGTPDYVMFAAWSVLGISQRQIVRVIVNSYRRYRLA